MIYKLGLLAELPDWWFLRYRFVNVRVLHLIVLAHELYTLDASILPRTAIMNAHHLIMCFFFTAAAVMEAAVMLLSICARHHTRYVNTGYFGEK